ncbi:MAG TPA: LiaF domain-containing protein [Bryobacteraceae bacterium]
MSEAPRDPNDWIRYGNVSENERAVLRQSCRNRSKAGRATLGIGAIALGVFLFLGNIGVFPSYNIWLFWPLLPLAGGVARLFGDRSTGRMWGVVMIFIGLLFLSLNLGWIHIHTEDGSWIVSLILIGVGFLALFRVLESSRRAQTAAPGAGPRPPHYWWRRPGLDAENAVGDLALLGALKRKMETTNFEGGELTTILGSIEIDLRSAAISSPENTAVLNTNAIFGAIKLRVPQYWRVHVQGASVLGNFEDKTIPPNTGTNAPVLVITGWSIFGSVEIED